MQTLDGLPHRHVRHLKWAIKHIPIHSPVNWHRCGNPPFVEHFPAETPFHISCAYHRKSYEPQPNLGLWRVVYIRAFSIFWKLSWGLEKDVYHQIAIFFLLTNTSSVFGSKGICIYTSSTAQGAGGSFKNRKPIGEIGCCESGMAKRTHWWTERCLRSPLFLSLSLTIYLPTNLSSMYLSIDLSISLFLSFI